MKKWIKSVDKSWLKRKNQSCVYNTLISELLTSHHSDMLPLIPNISDSFLKPTTSKTWTCTLKNLDPEKHGPSKTWTLENLDHEKRLDAVKRLGDCWMQKD